TKRAFSNATTTTLIFWEELPARIMCRTSKSSLELWYRPNEWCLDASRMGKRRRLRWWFRLTLARSNLARSVCNCVYGMGRPACLTTGQKFDDLPPDNKIELLEVGY